MRSIKLLCYSLATCLIFWQLYHYLLLDIERGGCGGTCLAVRLHPLVQELSCNGLHVDERSIRDEVKYRYGKSSNGTQHFLDESHDSPKPVRNRQYSNTRIARCIFMAYKETGEELIKDIKSGKRLK